LSSIEFGFRYADRENTKVQIQDRLQRNVDDLKVAPSLASVSMLLPFGVSGANTPSLQLAADPSKIRVIYYPGGNAVDGTFIRPNLPSLAPSEIVNGIDEGGGTGSRGNPNVEPFTAVCLGAHEGHDGAVLISGTGTR
jgi:hypothetical protein